MITTVCGSWKNIKIKTHVITELSGIVMCNPCAQGIVKRQLGVGSQANVHKV